MNLRTECACHHTVVPTFIPTEQAVVLDCGAFHGDFARWAAQRFNGRVISFEADPQLFHLLPTIPGVTFHNLAVAGADGNLSLRRSASRCSTAYFARTSPGDAEDFVTTARSLESFCDEHQIGEIDLLKMDIEGSELDVFECARDAFLMRIKQITCEFHDFLDSSQLPRINGVLRRLRGLGFLVLKMSYWTFGDVVMLNRHSLPLTPLTAPLMQAHRICAGMRRRIGRMTSSGSG